MENTYAGFDPMELRFFFQLPVVSERSALAVQQCLAGKQQSQENDREPEDFDFGAHKNLMAAYH